MIPSTYGDGAVSSDSVNLGSNPSSPATGNAGVSGISSDPIAAEKSEIAEQIADTGRTEVGTAIPDLIYLLRYHGQHCLTRGGEQSEAMLAAADMIQTLLGALSDIARHTINDSNAPHTVKGLKSIAAAALETPPSVCARMPAFNGHLTPISIRSNT